MAARLALRDLLEAGTPPYLRRQRETAVPGPDHCPAALARLASAIALLPALQQLLIRIAIAQVSGWRAVALDQGHGRRMKNDSPNRRTSDGGTADDFRHRQCERRSHHGARDALPRPGTESILPQSELRVGVRPATRP